MESRNSLRQVFVLFLLIFYVFENAVSASPFRLLEQKQFSQDTNADKKKLPPLQKQRQRKIDVKHIAIDLRFDWQKKQAYGTTAVTLAALNSTNKIALDAAMFTINSVTSSNGKPLKFEYDGGDKNDNLRITLNRVYKAEENVTVKIDYRTNWVNQIDPNSLGGNNGKGLRFSQPTSNDPIKPKEIWSVGDPESNRYWFPGYDSPDDFRTTEFTATVDKNLTVISNGNLVETKNNANGTHTFHYKMATPYANHLTSFVVGEFVNVKKNYDGIELNNFGYPLEKDWVDASTERLPDMVKFFSERTGAKYPYPNYSQVFVQDIGGFGGNSTTSTITENMVDDYETHADYFYLWDMTEAEALAHQWFGSYITARDWSNVWLNKSFAHYFNYLYNEHRNGRDEVLLWSYLYDQGVYSGDWNAGNRHPIVTKNFEDPAAFTGDNYATTRGALVLHMLRKHLGEEKWWKAIRLYVKTNANKLVTTEDFRKAVEQASGESMGWFFDQWLYKMGHPVFEVTKNYDEAKKQLTLNVKQTQKIDPKDEYPQVEFFQGKIDIEIDGRIEQVMLKAKPENIFTFASPQQPKFVNFDYESTWIGELKFDKSFEELLYQLQNSKDVLARRSAIIELVNIGKNEKTSAEDKAKIKAALRQTVLGNSYWRLRNTAMMQLVNMFGATPLDSETTTTILTVVKNEKSWFRANAISVLGNTRDPKFVDLYLNALNDPSYRVINQAAQALGKTKDAKAFDALAKLVSKPSMKSQGLLCALNGLKELGDPRGFDVAFAALSDLNLHRWRLPIPIAWDFRGVAVDLIASLGKSDKAYPLILERFKKSMDENDLDGIFNNVFLIAVLADPRGQEAFDMLKTKFKDDANTMKAVDTFEAQFKAAIKK